MARQMRELTAPLYLFLCLVLGGSAQGIWANMALQLLGLAIIAWAAWGPVHRMSGPARQLLTLALLAGVLVAVQMVPLPPSLWTGLGGRGVIARDYGTLGLPIPALSLSLTPFRSFDSLLRLIPPLAVFCGIVSLRAYRPTWLILAFLAGTVSGVLLGVLQVTNGGGGDFGTSRWYLYQESSFGLATGFFANANHMADLLLCAFPFLAALLASARGSERQRHSALYVLAVACGLLVAAGIALNHSLAVYLLILPVAAMSGLILLPRRSTSRRWMMLAAGVLLIAGLAAAWTGVLRGAPLGSDATTAVETRRTMIATSAEALRDFLPWGSGLGSFQSVYHLYEQPTQVTNTYVIHAHNDYVELALETGVPGILLMLAFVTWWCRMSWRSWRYPDAGTYARAASIASGAILIHSLVDFPLRTAAIAALFAMCLALLVERRPPVPRSVADLRPARHLVFR